MNRSLTALVVLALVAAPVLATDLTPDQESRLLKLAEQRVVEVLRDRPELLGQLPRVAGSALVDADHVQVDAYYVKDGVMVAHSAERFIFTVSNDHVVSVGAPSGEVAVVPPRTAVERAQSDAMARFAKVHPASGPEVADGTAPRVKTTRSDGGRITVECESFGGIAGMWMGDGIKFSYTSDGIFVAQSHN